METLHLLGALLPTLRPFPSSPPPPPSSHKKSQLQGGEGWVTHKGWNRRYGGYWKLEKLFFSGSVSPILQSAVAHYAIPFRRLIDKKTKELCRWGNNVNIPVWRPLLMIIMTLPFAMLLLRWKLISKQERKRTLLSQKNELSTMNI